MASKLVIVVRSDLGMTKGKTAAQVAHAAVAAALATQGSRQFADWMADGQPKVVLRVDGMDELVEVARAASAAGLPVELVQDAGRTQLPPGTASCCAVGPAPVEAVDAVTGKLRLL